MRMRQLFLKINFTTKSIVIYQLDIIPEWNYTHSLVIQSQLIKNYGLSVMKIVVADSRVWYILRCRSRLRAAFYFIREKGHGRNERSGI